MIKHPKFFWTVNAVLLATILAAWWIDPVHERVVRWLHDGYELLKAYLFSLFAALFLVKGKFVFKIFIQKIVMLSATGLTKRYLIEKVFTYHLKEHFIKHVVGDFKRLFRFIKRNFMRFSLGRKIVAGFALLGSLGYAAKFMGALIAMKVFLAKLWSFLLAVVLKTANWFVYFFTDYVWGSWLGPIVEVVIFSWLVTLLEKVPFLKRFFELIYRYTLGVIKLFDFVTERIFHLPLRKAMRWAVKQTRRLIYRFIGYKRVSAYFQLQDLRRFKPSFYAKLKQTRKSRFARLQEKKADRRSDKKPRLSRYAKRFSTSGS